MTKETEAEKIIREEKSAAQINLEEQKEEAKEATEADKPSKAEDMISAANAAAARQEEANVKHEELLTREAELKVETTLGGKAEAGQGGKAETPEEYKDRMMKGEDVKAD